MESARGDTQLHPNTQVVVCGRTSLSTLIFCLISTLFTVEPSRLDLFCGAGFFMGPKLGGQDGSRLPSAFVGSVMLLRDIQIQLFPSFAQNIHRRTSPARSLTASPERRSPEPMVARPKMPGTERKAKPHTTTTAFFSIRRSGTPAVSLDGRAGGF